MQALPPELLDLVLSFHMPVCAQEFAGNPSYVLYWCYDKRALRQILGMTRDEYRVIESKMGRFLRRVPKTNRWLATLTDTPGWALTNRSRGPGPLGLGRGRPNPPIGRMRPQPISQISQNAYIGLPAREHHHFT